MGFFRPDSLCLCASVVNRFSVLLHPLLLIVRLHIPSKAFRGFAAHLAFGAGADFTEVLPRVDPVLVIVVPGEADRVFADRFDFGGSRQRFEERQGTGNRLRRVAWLAAFFRALVVTESAGAGVSQKDKGVAGAVAVFPLELHAVAGGLVNFDGLGVGGHDSLL